MITEHVTCHTRLTTKCIYSNVMSGDLHMYNFSHGVGLVLHSM